PSAVRSSTTVMRWMLLRNELLFAGRVVLDEHVATELGEQRVALVGAGGDELVAVVQHDVTTRPVEVAAAAADGQQVEAGLGLELAPSQRCAVRGGTFADVLSS